MISMILLFVLLLSGCNSAKEEVPSHEHDFSQKKEAPEFLKSEATCTDFAEYYFSCSCGAKGEETFKGVTKLAHDFTKCVEDAKYLKDAGSCEKPPTYCCICSVCGRRSGVHTFEGSVTVNHDYSVEDPHGRYIKTEATESAPATYYKSCKCGAMGTESFSYGEVMREYSAEEKVYYKPTSLTLTLYDVEDRLYGITYNTQKRPLRPVIRVCEGNTMNDNYVEYPATVEEASSYTDSDEKFTYYIVKAEIRMEDLKTYSYCAYDKYVKIGTEVATVTTKDLDSNSFTFVHVSDSQSDASVGGSYFGEVLSNVVGNADFIIHTGDVVENSKHESEWESMLDDNFDHLSSIPMMAISGNHETTYKNGSNETYKHFNNQMPEQDSTSLGYFYSFVYGNTKFIMLNTNELSGSNYLKDDQYDWLIDQFENNDCTWTIVAMHNPMYSVGKYGSDPSRNAICLSLRRQLQDIFFEYGVDLVLQGHDHAISRTYPINGDGDVIKEDWTNVDGTKYSVDPTGVIYLMNGPAGPQSRAPYYSYDASKYEYAQTSHSRSWAEITVEDSVLTVTVRYYNGVYQTWGIIKNQ